MEKRKGRRTEPEIRKLVAGYENGTQSRGAYCVAHGLPLTTLDYYRRRFRPVAASLVEIDLHETNTTTAAVRPGSVDGKRSANPSLARNPQPKLT